MNLSAFSTKTYTIDTRAETKIWLYVTRDSRIEV